MYERQWKAGQWKGSDKAVKSSVRHCLTNQAVKEQRKTVSRHREPGSERAVQDSVSPLRPEAAQSLQPPCAASCCSYGCRAPIVADADTSDSAEAFNNSVIQSNGEEHASLPYPPVSVASPPALAPPAPILYSSRLPAQACGS